MTEFAETWVDEYGDQLFRFAYNKVNNREKAEDLVQETFFSALQGFENFQQKSSVKNWLYSILKHKIIDYYRSKARKQTETYENDDFIDHLFHDDGHWKEQVPAWSSPDKVLDDKEFQAVLDQCVDNLPDSQKDVFTYRDLNGFSGDEICKILDISSSNLWVITHRARQKLRDCLTFNWFGEAK